MQYYHINTIEKQSAGHLITLTGEEVHRGINYCNVYSIYNDGGVNRTVLFYYCYFSPITGVGILAF